MDKLAANEVYTAPALKLALTRRISRYGLRPGKLSGS